MQTNVIDYKRLIEQKGSIAFVPSGNSMWPTLKNAKQSVIVKKVEGDLSLYDVVFFKRNDGSFILHRIIKIEGQTYVVCGDSQYITERVEKEQIFGVMVGFYKGKKYVDCNDQKYKDSVIAWYTNTKRRRRKLKLFYLKNKVKNLFKKGK